MPANYVLLEKITVGAASAASVSFTSIPQTGYTDLVIKGSARSLRASDEDGMGFGINGTGATDWVLLSGNGSLASSGTLSSLGFGAAFVGRIPGANATANTFGNFELYLPNYTSSNVKSYSADAATENNSSTAYLSMLAAYQSNTSAVTSIILLAGNANLAPNSTFYLYGVAKLGTTPAISPYATGGSNITTDGTYWIHTFTSSGTFTPQKALSCDYLVVAGGGGGGANHISNYDAGAGGGGAGGLRSTVTATGGGGSLESALSLASGVGYTVTVGAGGAGGTYGSNGTNSRGTTGSNSVFSTITSSGGGGGGTGGESTSNQDGKNGGSGGGSGGDVGVVRTAGTGTANQGYAGGTGILTRYGGGGGGGAGAVGGNATVSGGGSIGGTGGAGVATSISGSSVVYSGGGGSGGYGASGGTGGSGGGGNGGYLSGSQPTSGTSNTGGGGGGGGQQTNTVVNGGSGVVIVRYPV
jgi:hypothetical protein